MFKAAIIGLGNIGLTYDLEKNRPHPSSHVMGFEQSNAFELVCAIDEDSSKKRLLKRISPNCAFFENLEAAISSGILNGVDVISVCTPPLSHGTIVRNIIAHTTIKTVFCEKPLAENYNEANEIKCIAERNGVTIVPNISRRWNREHRRITKDICDKRFGNLKKIHVRYTRGIYNTGTHLFDLLRMWTDKKIVKVTTMEKVDTSALTEDSYSFYFILENGVTGYAEAIDDRNYYLFDIDLYFTKGKIEMRNSGDDILYYGIHEHHLFQDFLELKLVEYKSSVLEDSCIANAIENIARFIYGREQIYCSVEDAIYPLQVATAVIDSYNSKKTKEVGK